MSDEARKRWEQIALMVATALATALTTQLSNCSAGIATKGDLTAAVSKLATKDDVAAIAAKVEGVSAEQKAQHDADAARDLRAAIVLREQTAAIVASWRVQSSGQQRRVWADAHESARGKWNDFPGRPIDEIMERVLLSAGVPQ